MMASILLLWVFLLLITGILLGGLEVGLLGRLTISSRRAIGGVLVGSVRTGVTGGSPCVFLGFGVLGILYRSATLLFVRAAMNIARKFLIAFLILLALFTNISY